MTSATPTIRLPIADPAPRRTPAPHRDRTRPPRATVLLIALLPTLLAGVLCWYQAAQREMWADEFATWRGATVSWPQLWHLLTHIDLVHGLYYALMHGWVQLFGDSQLALRVPSILAGALSAGLVTLLGRRLFSTPVGLLAGLLYALLPAIARFGQEARSYELVTLFAVGATLLLLRALEYPSVPRWTGYTVVVALTGWLHFVALLVLVAHALYLLLETRRGDDRRWQWVGACGTAAVLVIPLLSQAGHQSGAIDWIHADAATLRRLPDQLFGALPVAAVLVAVGVLGAVLLARSRPAAVVTLLLWALVPPVLTYLTFPVLHLFLFRYFLFTLPAWALLAAAAVDALAGRTGRARRPVAALAGVAVLAAVVWYGLPAQRSLRDSPVAGQPDYRAAMAVIGADARPGDGIAYADVVGGNTDLARKAADYYLRGTAHPRDVFLLSTGAERGYFTATECAEAAPCLGDTARLWLVATPALAPDPYAVLPADRAALLRTGFQQEREYRFSQVHLILLTRKPA